MQELLCFVAVEFVDDPNVVGVAYWYLCDFKDVKVGDWIVAPLGRHNNLQEGIIREIRFRTEYEAPFPVHSIKYIRALKKESINVQNCK